MRAERYEQLQWANRGGCLQAFIAAGDFQPDDRVLDVGTGTGIVAQAVSPLVAEVVEVDLSPEMLARAKASRVVNEAFEEGDIRRLRFPDNRFDKVTARMIFHHLIKHSDQAMKECYRVLKPNMHMKILHIVGARPNFMKIAPIMEEMVRYPDHFNQVLVHTGQHYDDEMSQVFFNDLNVPCTDIDLGIGSGSHHEQAVSNRAT